MPAVDTFESYTSGVTASATGGFAVTPHDTNELPFVTREIRVAGAGNLNLVMMNGDELLIEDVAAGERFAYRVRQVKASGTTATKITAAY